ncbi:MAG: hypothetical protein LJE68_09380 [Rhodobacter sp.]|nr:hypothetical protein [Rhodobacter sp.]
MAQSAGYSATPLAGKLGFKPGSDVLVLDAPDHYDELLAGAEDVNFHHRAGDVAQDFDAAHVFLHDPGRIAAQAEFAIGRLRPGGMLWLSWAKKSSGLHAGVTEDSLRTHVLPLGWVDVKVCAVDADWSGLKFLKRKEKPASNG